jgi:hypothetical protein
MVLYLAIRAGLVEEIAFCPGDPAVVGSGLRW